MFGRGAGHAGQDVSAAARASMYGARQGTAPRVRQTVGTEGLPLGGTANAAESAAHGIEPTRIMPSEASTQMMQAPQAAASGGGAGWMLPAGLGVAGGLGAGFAAGRVGDEERASHGRNIAFGAGAATGLVAPRILSGLASRAQRLAYGGGDPYGQ